MTSPAPPLLLPSFTPLSTLVYPQKSPNSSRRRASNAEPGGGNLRESLNIDSLLRSQAVGKKVKKMTGSGTSSSEDKVSQLPPPVAYSNNGTTLTFRLENPMRLEGVRLRMKIPGINTPPSSSRSSISGLASVVTAGGIVGIKPSVTNYELPGRDGRRRGETEKEYLDSLFAQSIATSAAATSTSSTTTEPKAAAVTKINYDEKAAIYNDYRNNNHRLPVIKYLDDLVHECGGGDSGNKFATASAATATIADARALRKIRKRKEALLTEISRRKVEKFAEMVGKDGCDMAHDDNGDEEKSFGLLSAARTKEWLSNRASFRASQKLVMETERNDFEISKSASGARTR